MGLFSATMTKKVAKLQRASLKDPVKVEVSGSYQTVDKLLQYYLFIPLKLKELYLVHIMNEMAGNSFMIFCSTCSATLRLSLMLRALGFTAIPLNGQMSQNKRLASLNKFKSKSRSILLATDVASRGLDIPHVDIVVNYDIPTHSKDYIHRVGRTARAGRSGKAITFVSQYDIELYQRIEHLIGKKLPLYEIVDDEVMVYSGRPWKCTICGKAFQFRGDYNRHLVVHSAVRTFTCPTCGLGFKRKDNFNSHLATHSMARPFKCQTCNKTFKRKADKEVHERIHTGERAKEFRCSKCNKGFYRSSTRNQHERVVCS